MDGYGMEGRRIFTLPGAVAAFWLTHQNWSWVVHVTTRQVGIRQSRNMDYFFEGWRKNTGGFVFLLWFWMQFLVNFRPSCDSTPDCHRSVHPDVFVKSPLLILIPLQFQYVISSLPPPYFPNSTHFSYSSCEKGREKKERRGKTFYAFSVPT